MKKTSLHQNHLSLNAKMTDYAGFSMPLVYKGIKEEHESVRNACGIFDVSHMGEILITGPDALLFANKLLTQKIDLDLSKVFYSLLLSHDGYPLDDLLLYVLEEDQVLLVVNASNTDKDYDWILSQVGNHDVVVENVSNYYSQIALQGPLAHDYLKTLLGDALPILDFMHYQMIYFNDWDLIISRSGYTGEDGYEIYGSHVAIKALFEKLIDLGASPCGLGSRDTLRFEAGLPLYGHEISEEINPLEANLSFAINFEKDFIGKDALINMKNNPKKRIVGIELLERGIPRAGYEVYLNQQKIGVITTGYLSITNQKPIALGLVDLPYDQIGTEVNVLIRNQHVKAKIRNRKFYNKKYKK